MSKDHNFWRERKAEAEWNRGPSAYQPNALPLGQTGSLTRDWEVLYFYTCETPMLTRGGLGVGGGWMCKRVSVYVSVCVCCTHLFSIFFSLAFVLVNDLSPVSRCFLFRKCVRFCFRFLLPFVSFCCMHLYFMFTAVSYQMFFYWCSFMYSQWGFWNKPLDLTWFDLTCHHVMHVLFKAVQLTSREKWTGLA